MTATPNDQNIPHANPKADGSRRVGDSEAITAATTVLDKKVPETYNQSILRIWVEGIDIALRECVVKMTS
ncbi:hypothetical protein ACFFQF_27270 [Haladaptatus pallidirubidus]|uniref:Uncharacterized protein n=1 Tax=Haladaptatus pallidirubidus TaxID=1008152 RepID=A0AAV3UI98_9EURY